MLKQAVTDHYTAQLDDSEVVAIRNVSLKILHETGSNCDWLIEDLNAAAEAADPQR